MCWFNSGEKNMPDLEKQIAEWRRQMLAAGVKSPVPLDELESHLRDDIEQQVRKNVGAQEAFDAAVHQLGCADVLKREFKRGRFDLRRVSPVYLRVYCILCMPLVLSLIWSSIVREAGIVQFYVGMVIVLLIALYIGGLPLFYRRLFSRQNRLMGAALRVGYWFAVIWPALALLSASELIHFGKVVDMVVWSAFAAYFATFLAGAIFARENTMAQMTKLARSH